MISGKIITGESVRNTKMNPRVISWSCNYGQRTRKKRWLLLADWVSETR